MKPILFNTGMVKAILEGRKTVTRRVVKPQPPAHTHLQHTSGQFAWSFWEDSEKHWLKAPYQPGDILYVRETWAYSQDADPVRIIYKADNPTGPVERWFPSVHMEKRDARIFLRVTDVRVERLWDIDEEQARAEGTQPLMLSCDPEDTPENKRVWHEVLPALPRFPELWDSTIKPSDPARYGWNANPWVWVFKFERISKEDVLKP